MAALRGMGSEIRVAWRQLARARTFSLTVLLTLAVGIGACAAIFTVVHGVLLAPLPFRQPRHLLLIKEQVPPFGAGRAWGVSAPDIAPLARGQRVFTGVASFGADAFDLSGGGAPPQRIPAARVSYNLFPLLGVRPLLGRTFTRQEDLGGAPVALLSYGLWQRRFGGDAGIVGQSIRLDDKSYTITGVMPPRLEFPPRGLEGMQPAQIWVPISFTRAELTDIGDNFDYGVIGRLRPGVSLAAARADLAGVAAAIQRASWPSAAQIGVRYRLEMPAFLLKSQVTGPVRAPLLLLLAAVALVLLVACANVAHLSLARLEARRQEWAIRAALGAGRAGLLRAALVESAILAAGGGLLGLGLAAWAVPLLLAAAPRRLPRLAAVHLDGAVVAFTFALAAGTLLIFGAWPAWRAARRDPAAALQAGGRTLAGGSPRLRAGLVVAETALAFVLLAAAGLLLRSFWHVLDTPPGFSLDGLSFQLYLPPQQYPNRAAIAGFYHRLRARLQALPGVRGVTLASSAPLSTSWNHLVTVPGPAEGRPPMVWHNEVGPDYFRVLGIPLLGGRAFNAGDRLHSPGVVILNQAAARRLFARQNPLGRRIAWGVGRSHGPWLTVVGVAGNVREGRLSRPVAPHSYAPYAQSASAFPQRFVLLRAAGDPAALASAVRRTVHGLDPALALAHLASTRRIVAAASAPRRLATALAALFALAGLFLAAAGLYGVLAYAVERKRRDLGIRLALGARPGEVVAQVVGAGMRLVLAGGAVGAVAALLFTRLLRAELYGVGGADPAVWALCCGLLAAVALFAAWLPARRAARTDPAIVLRQE